MIHRTVNHMHNTSIIGILGNLIEQSDCDALVNSAHPSMLAGSGVCGVIHKAAGKELEIYGRRFAPLKVAEAVLTPAFNLPNQYIIHVSAPRYHSDPDPLNKLRAALCNVFKLAEMHQLKRIALPAIATGIYSFPMIEAIKIYIDVAKSFGASKSIEEIRYVFTRQDDLKSFIDCMQS